MKKLLTAVFAVCLLSAGCGSDENAGRLKETDDSRKISKETAPPVEKPVYGGARIEASMGDASALIPNITSDSASHDVGGQIFSGLVKYDKNLKVTGDLAESWDISEDKKTITFHLRKNVLWHDGVPFTAADVEFTYNFMIDDDTPTVYDGDFRRVKSFEVIDKYTVKVSYDRPYAPALISWGMSVLPKHLLDGKDVTKSPLLRNPVGTGPYKFHEWKSGESITLIANEDYFEGRPYLDRLVYRIIPDSATIFLELLNGSVDIMGLTPLQWEKQTDANKRFTDNYDKYKYLSSSYTYIGYNLNHPLFNDVSVRRALTHATPKDKIIKGLMFGLAQPATGPFKPGTIWHNEDVPEYPYDIEKARKMLKDAGWEDTNGDGTIDKNGREFKFQLMTNQGNSQRQKIAEIVQQSWSNLGISVEVRVLEWATFINEYINKQKFEAVILGWNITHDPDLFDVWHSSNCGGRKLNFVCFKNDRLDELIVKGQQVFDPEERKTYYREAHKILAEEQPYTFLYYPMALISVHKRFKNIKPEPAGIDYNLIKWYVPKDQQKYHFQQ